MSDQGGELEALDRAIRETKEEPGPDLDWDRMESRLFERIEAAEVEERASGPSRRSRVIAALAAAAVIALGSAALLRSNEPATQLGQTPVPAAAGARVIGPGVKSVDGASLHEGDRVVAGSEPVEVEHRGTASWTLEPRSEAVVAAAGRFLTIRLESGAVSAKVVPAPTPESLAGEVRTHRRLAAHSGRQRSLRLRRS
jgi:hypothetical protein